MVKISDVRASNANIRTTFPSPVAVFVGATSGIGESTLEHLVQNTDSPTVYFVGRSETAGSRITQKLKDLNPAGTYHFIASDVSLLANVDKVCDEIKAKEKKVDLMVLSCGYLSFDGRTETTEGLDTLLSLRYYARLRFITALLPLHPTHILSVLAATTEGPLLETDLALKSPNSYGILPCATHSATMTSLALEHLAPSHPSTAFVHAYPGIVKTQALRRGLPPWLIFLLSWIVLPLLTPFTTSPSECGERMLFCLTSARFPPRRSAVSGAEARAAGVARPAGVEVAGGGVGGAYLVGATGETGEGKAMAGFRSRGFGEKVWEHTMDTFAEVEAKTR